MYITNKLKFKIMPKGRPKKYQTEEERKAVNHLNMIKAAKKWREANPEKAKECAKRSSINQYNRKKLAKMNNENSN